MPHRSRPYWSRPKCSSPTSWTPRRPTHRCDRVAAGGRAVREAFAYGAATFEGVEELPAPSARGSAEAPRVRASPTAARGLLHPKLTAVQVLAVELRDRLIGLFRRGHLHETEAARATGLAIGHDGGRFDLAGRREHFAKSLRRRGERETADEQFLRHGAPPLLLLPRCEFTHAPENADGR